MSNDTDWIQPGVQAVVTLATAENSGEVMIDGCERWIPQSALRPLPPPLSPTAARLEAEKARLMEALADLAKQDYSGAMEDDAREHADFEGAYNTMIGIARAALDPQP